MNIDLFDQQQKAWEAHFIESRRSLARLLENEKRVRAYYTKRASELPAAERDALQFNRKQWTDEWGAQGTRVVSLSKQHSQQAEDFETIRRLNEECRSNSVSENVFASYMAELGYSPDRPSETDMERMYQDHLEEELEEYIDPDYTSSILMTGEEFFDYLASNTQRNHPVNEAPGTEESNAQQKDIAQSHEKTEGERHKEQVLASQAERSKVWRELINEQHAVTNFYESQDKPVPEVTERRMAKQFAAFKAEYDGIGSKIPLHDWKTLEKEDLQDEMQSWCDLMEHHEIIEHHYLDQNNVPESTRARMTLEVSEYWTEVENWQAAEKVTPAPIQESIASQNFREQLDQIRQKQHTEMRPKGPT